MKVSRTVLKTNGVGDNLVEFNMPLPYPLLFGQAYKPDSACCNLRWFGRSFTRIGLTMSSCFLATILG